MCMIFQENGNRGIAQKPSKQFYTLLYRSQRPDFMSNYSFFQNGCFSNFPKDSMRILCKKGQNYWKYRVCTLFQKLPKCEVRAWLCWNLIILPPLRFSMKSNFDEFEQLKYVIFGNIRGSEFWFFVNLSNFQLPNLPNFKVPSLWNCQKWHYWTVWICQILILRKIWVAVKWSTFNQVKP